MRSLGTWCLLHCQRKVCGLASLESLAQTYEGKISLYILSLPNYPQKSLSSGHTSARLKIPPMKTVILVYFSMYTF